MRRTIIATLTLLFFSMASMAAHIAGGEMSYKFLGAHSGGTVGSYEITLRLYRDCNSPPSAAALDDIASITIYAQGSLSPFLNLMVNRQDVKRTFLTNPGPCITNPPFVCYDIGIYTVTVDLPFTTSGYAISYQRCCRINGISNASNSGAAGATYTANVPGLLDHPSGPRNSSPVFEYGDTVLVCQTSGFSYDFSAKDADGDSLVYAFADAYNYVANGNFQPTTAEPPPYQSLNYSFGFDSNHPLGTDVAIDRKTGVTTGKAPADGIYVVTVEVMEYREGKLINRHRKDLHIRVADCNIASVELDPTYITCDGFTLTFQNNNNSPLITSYFWDFGLTGATNDTSNLSRPSFSFPDTGVYKVTLITNRGKDCSDTGFTLAKVYPGFFPGFSVDDGCKNVPLGFKDLTTTRYGVVDYWRWNFGHPLINPKTDSIQNPKYTYPDIGNYDVQLIVGNSKGCRDTIDKRVNVLDKPGLKVTQNQPLCLGDSLQLEAVGTGDFSWSPNTGLTDAAISNPIAFPKVKTKYYVTLTNAPGCVNRDSVEIDVKSFVTLDAGKDTTICLTDEIQLMPVTDGVKFSWQPSATLNDASAKNPKAKPTGTTDYVLTAWIGDKKNCISTDAVRVTAIPYPAVNVSPDTAICFGDTAQLRAGGGTEYRWTPVTNLSGNTSPNPLIWPVRNTTYRVSVRDNVGCPKPSFADIRITVTTKILANAGNDTAMVVGQPLRLQAKGGDSYQWSPSAGLSNPNIANPEVVINEDQTYVVKVMTDIGCFAYDTVNIRVFKTDPDIFVPTAFTPNGDDLNDVLIPIAVGISDFQFFRVYNRWGLLVYSSTKPGAGWDGKVKGREQGTDTFLWHVRGRDYGGRVIEKKGTTLLMR